MDITIIIQVPYCMMLGWELLKSKGEVDGFVIHLLFFSVEFDWGSDENSGGFVIR